MTHDSCWYQHVCNKPIEWGPCTNKCPRYTAMLSMFEHSNLPEKKWLPISLTPDDCDYDAFVRLSEIKSDIEQFVTTGSNLYICGRHAGNGKTSWAIKLLQSYFNSIWDIVGGVNFCRGVFVHVPTYLLAVKNFNNFDANTRWLQQVLPEVDLVVFDDMAGAGVSQYDFTQILSIVDRRTLAEKSNIFTGNIVDRAVYDKNYGARLTSRVWDTSEIIELRGASYR